MRTLFTGTHCLNPDYIHTPLIELVALDDRHEIHDAIRSLISSDTLLFTSRYAVRFWHEAMQEIHHSWGEQRIVSIGAVTTQTLLELGANHIEQAVKDDSYGVIEHFKGAPPQGRIVCPRSERALDILPNGLRQLGITFCPVITYRNRLPLHPLKVNLTEIDSIVFTSPSTIDHFIQLYGSLPPDKTYITRGAITEQYLNQRRYEKI
uniref:Tetrapyrrole biosynthesis uroporphyrinogen III synthase domain-containing protein n=1 Tax=Prevotella sp. GTC17259 TaxID=3236795 RepID=A0AB33J8R6_9BACT